MNLANIKHLNLHNKSLIKLFLRNKLIWQKMSRVLKEWRGFSPLTCTPTVAGNFEDIKIYGNSEQNGIPSPSSPIEVESVGDKTKNLFDKDNFETSTLYLPNATIDGTGMLVNASTLLGFIFDVRKIDGNITISRSINGGAFRVFGATEYPAVRGTATCLAIENDNLTATCDVTNYSYLAVICVTGDKNALRNIVQNLQIEKGSQATDYEPYGYKIPVKVGSENLFDKSQQYISYAEVIKDLSKPTATKANVYATTKVGDILGDGANPKGIAIPCKKGDTFSIKCFGAITSARLYFVETDENAKILFERKPWNKNGAKITITEDDTKILWIEWSIDIVDNADVVVVKGDKIPDTYIPYIEPVTTNVYLDEPLRKVDVHADYVDSKNNKLVREMKELTFTGYEDWFTSSSAGKHYYSIPKSALGTDLPHGSDDILCSHFKVYAGDVSALPVGQVCVGNNNVNFNFDGTNEDIAGFETWLSQNNVKLYYPLTTPTEETYTIDNPIMALDNTSIIAVDTTIPPSEIYASEYVDG